MHQDHGKSVQYAGSPKRIAAMGETFVQRANAHQ